jgi:NADH dehydrogenase
MSALNADVNGPSQYLRSRGRGEAAVWAVAEANPSLSVTMFQPSVVFGERDKFLNLFAHLMKAFPLMPLGSPNAQFQPVWVEDVARAIVMSLNSAEEKNKTYPLVGPKVYTLRELLEFVAFVTARRCLIMGLGPTLSMLQAVVFGMLPGKVITPDNVRSMRLPSTSDTPFPAQFGGASAMEGVVSAYLSPDNPGRHSTQQQSSKTVER